MKDYGISFAKVLAKRLAEYHRGIQQVGLLLLDLFSVISPFEFPRRIFIDITQVLNDFTT